jgi:hypothetical protein
MNTLFISPYKEFSIVLKSGEKNIVETNNGRQVERTPEIRVDFKNYKFDASNCNLPWKKERIVAELRKDAAFGKYYKQPGKPPVTASKLVNMSVRDLNDADEDFNEIARPSILIDAIEMEKERDNRSTVLRMFKKELKDKFKMDYDAMKVDEE